MANLQRQHNQTVENNILAAQAAAAAADSAAAAGVPLLPWHIHTDSAWCC
jgi:hypothetical protein